MAYAVCDSHSDCNTTGRGICLTNWCSCTDGYSPVLWCTEPAAGDAFLRTVQAVTVTIAAAIFLGSVHRLFLLFLHPGSSERSSARVRKAIMAFLVLHNLTNLVVLVNTADHYEYYPAEFAFIALSLSIFFLLAAVGLWARIFIATTARFDEQSRRFVRVYDPLMGTVLFVALVVPIVAMAAAPRHAINVLNVLSILACLVFNVVLWVFSRRVFAAMWQQRKLRRLRQQKSSARVNNGAGGPSSPDPGGSIATTYEEAAEGLRKTVALTHLVSLFMGVDVALMVFGPAAGLWQDTLVTYTIFDVNLRLGQLVGAALLLYAFRTKASTAAAAAYAPAAPAAPVSTPGGAVVLTLSRQAASSDRKALFSPSDASARGPRQSRQQQQQEPVSVQTAGSEMISPVAAWQ